jgi:hypothetical protein
MEWYEVWLWIGAITLFAETCLTTAGRSGLDDIRLLIGAHPSKIVAIAGVVAIFSFAILLGPIGTIKGFYDRHKWRQLKKQFPKEFGD